MIEIILLVKENKNCVYSLLKQIELVLLNKRYFNKLICRVKIISLVNVNKLRNELKSMRLSYDYSLTDFSNLGRKQILIKLKNLLKKDCNKKIIIKLDSNIVDGLKNITLFDLYYVIGSSQVLDQGIIRSNSLCTLEYKSLLMRKVFFWKGVVMGLINNLLSKQYIFKRKSMIIWGSDININRNIYKLV